MKTIQMLTMACMVLAGGAGCVLAQDMDSPAADQVATGEAEAQYLSNVVWSDPEFAAIAAKLTGNWKTTEPVPAMGAEGEPVDVIMSIMPVKLSDFPDAFYVETARADELAHPYRSSFLQLYRRQGAIRMRTLEIRDPNSNLHNLVIGMWAAPESFPDIKADKLIGTLDLEMLGTGDAYVGQTPYPYPNATNGAVEMTSRMAISDDRIQTADTGYDADGNVVWGANGSALTFEPTESPFKVDREDTGIVVITLVDNTETEPAKDGDQVAFQYSGWLTNGKMFDTSRQPGKRPLQYQLPGQLIQGWKIAVDGMSKGDWRKFILPPDFGYGGSGAAGGAIPPSATLIFEAACVNVTPPPPPPANQTPINSKP